MFEADQSDVIAFLADPATHGGRSVERISTHSAHVFLAGDRAYKLKRAVRLPFLDFSTLEKRRAAIETEFAINFVTAPSIYLRVAPVRRRPSGALAFEDGEIADWVLVMRRFPQSALLDNMAAAQSLTPSIIDELTGVVVDMHRRAEPVTSETAPAFRAMALENVRELRNAAVDQTAVGDLETDLARALSVLERYMTERGAGGFVRRLHGDLHLGNIAMVDDKPTPFDALEFDPALATGDVYYDLAFLLMDLEHRGLRSMANRVMNRYVQLTGDIHGLRGLPLYLAVRAAIRSKVNLLAGKFALASEYLAMAAGYLPAKEPRIIAVGGLSGTGKSQLAMAIAPDEANAPGAIVLRSDVVRKELCGVAETTRLSRASYTPELSATVYRTLFERAKATIEAGRTVIVDAVFATPHERLLLEQVAAELRVPFRGIWLEASIEARRERVDARRDDASDADRGVVELQESYDPGGISWSRCNASRSPTLVQAEVRNILGR